ncbi:Ig-like domain-containing protein [Murimonas intestini]|uniref:Ig-like domain-containing protein n=1 Tax=Murimonas intestini TaxID=1337051 RepID=UPI0011DC9A15|nr:Ig-like domain-containing protein [Murimonas intestini]
MVNTVKVTINNQTYNCTLDSSTGKYVATITAPGNSSYSQPDHYYPVSVTATDQANNTTTVNSADSTLGTKLRLVVKEKTAPVITITTPTKDAYITNSKPTITWDVTDNDSGVNASSASLIIDSGAKITTGFTQTAITNGYRFTYTPTTALSDGAHTIKVDVMDNDGNAATQKVNSFKIDTVPPTLSLSTPTDNSLTNKMSCNITGMTADVTSGLASLTVKINSDAAQAVTVGENGSFTHSVNLTDGENTITVVATDVVGKTTTVVRHVTLDRVAPVITDVVISPSAPTTGEVFTITVTVTDA